MGVLPDWMINRDIEITPRAEGIKREGVISYGTTSYGYDARLGYVFKVFKAYPCSTIDPKNFDQRMLEEIDLTPTHNHKWETVDIHKHADTPKEGLKCINCGAWQGTPSEKSYQCPTHKPNWIDIPPHSFILGESLEEFRIPRDCLCLVVGKSTYARCGIIINVTPGEPEWKGKWTIEISNTTPLPARVYAGEGIMQCIFLRSDGYREVIQHALGTKIANEDLKILAAYRDTLERGTSCRTSYADKKGKYQDQTGLKTPEVDK